MVLLVYAAIALFLIVCPTLWVLVKLGPWSAPLSGSAGLLIMWVGAQAGSGRTMAYGFGLFMTSVVFFILGGGLSGR